MTAQYLSDEHLLTISEAKRRWFLEQRQWSVSRLAASLDRLTRMGLRPTRDNIWFCGVEGSQFPNLIKRENPEQAGYLTSEQLGKRWGYIYEVRLPDGSCYIGQHKQQPRRHFHHYMGSGYQLIERYFVLGVDATTKHLLCFVNTAEEADLEETRHICEALIAGKALLNQSFGGSEHSRQALASLVEAATPGPQHWTLADSERTRNGRNAP